uniref:MACPF domain-containing protein n=1 Tax=Panagrolaimus sp. ES5 TaxID=591445 RepID=A0AC34FIX5_9BILA
MGDIYNMKIDSFIKKNLFKKKLGEPFVKVYDTPNSENLFLYGNDPNEKAEALDIRGTLKLRLLSGGMALAGTSAFIKHDNDNNNKLHYSYILKTKTKEESIDWRSDELKKYYNFKGIENYGTHMVVGIQYGGNAVVTLSYDNILEEHEREDISPNEKAAYMKSKLENFVKTSSESLEKDLSITNDKNITIYSDTYIHIESPATFLKNFNQNLSQHNQGKGVKVAYEIIPLDIIFNNFDVVFKKSIIFRPLSDHLLFTLKELICEKETAKKTSFARNSEIRKNYDYFTKAEQDEYHKKYSSLHSQSDLRKTLSIIGRYYDSVTDGDDIEPKMDVHFKSEIPIQRFNSDTFNTLNKCKVNDLTNVDKFLSDQIQIIGHFKSEVDKFMISTQKFVIKSDFINTAKKYEISYVTTNFQLQHYLVPKQLGLNFVLQKESNEDLEESLKLIFQQFKEVVKERYLEWDNNDADAVIAFSANFTADQQDIIKKAAAKTGWNILHSLNEQFAVTLTHYYQNFERCCDNPLNILILNFGATKLGIAVLKNHNTVQVIANDTTIGGNQIDLNFTKYLFNILEKTSVFLEKSALEKIGKHIKEFLSKSKVWTLKEWKKYSKHEDITNPFDFDIRITRAEFESSCEELFTAAIKAIDKALNDAKLLPQNINKVLLVGGSSRIPKIQKMLKTKFGPDKIVTNFLVLKGLKNSADYVVAYGAAIQAAILINGLEKFPSFATQNRTLKKS